MVVVGKVVFMLSNSNNDNITGFFLNYKKFKGLKDISSEEEIALFFGDEFHSHMLENYDFKLEYNRKISEMR